MIKKIINIFKKIFKGSQGINYKRTSLNRNEEIVNSRKSIDKHSNRVQIKKGDIIGKKYEICDILGIGGFGIVYLAISCKDGSIYALKTYKGDFSINDERVELFKKEAQTWISLDRHACLVRAYFVEQIDDRFYIGMEYIAPNSDGLNSLDSFLDKKPPDTIQSLRWAIQFCYGMEYAYSKGVRCHRDIKPANIMIAIDNTIKISDFGLAGMMINSSNLSCVQLKFNNKRIGLSINTIDGVIGTPTHMPPEQFINAALCDRRSDIYSFGIVIFQMCANGCLPFFPPVPKNNSEDEFVRFWRSIKELHCHYPVPHVDSPLFPIISKCLEKDPNKRYQTFKELRLDLEQILYSMNKEKVRIPELMELEIWELSNKGYSFNILGLYDQALDYLDKSLLLDPTFSYSWLNKGVVLGNMNRFDEAILCYEKSILNNPSDKRAHLNLGSCLARKEKYHEAITYFDNAISIDPNYADAWNNKGASLAELKNYDEAIKCYDNALRVDPYLKVGWLNKGNLLLKICNFGEAINCLENSLKNNQTDKEILCQIGYCHVELKNFENAINIYNTILSYDSSLASIWGNKGACLLEIDKNEEAIKCIEKSIELNPNLSQTWCNKGKALMKMCKYEQAIIAYNQAIKLDPRFETAWGKKGVCFYNLGKKDDALVCFDEIIKINPKNTFAWYNKGTYFLDNGDLDMSLDCFDKALSIDSNNENAWKNKGVCLVRMNKFLEAIECYNKALIISPNDCILWYNKAIVYESIDKYSDAKRCFNEFLLKADNIYDVQISDAKEKIKYL